ncbi:DUF975 family protein [Scopulibacillus cellulosilyticus]|uniref:DUF975 family protein n=1 Tax=Scopulibacillus cellulosilyticus TaxID=2665665 RepID=A0ABW2Q0Y8_9BACL
MKIGEIKRAARSSLRHRWWRSLLIILIGFIIYGVIPNIIEAILSGGFDKVDTPEEPFSAVIVSLILSIGLLPIMVGQYWAFLGISRGENIKVKSLFDAFSSVALYFKSLGLIILISIFTFLWSLLFIIPGIIKALAYSQAYFIMKDNPDYSITEAITASRKLMNGHKWHFFLLLLSFIGWWILSIFTLFIGLLWLLPYIFTSWAKFYENLLDKPELAE